MKRILAFGIVAAAIAAIVLAVILLRPSQKGGPQPIAYGRDACARCRMRIAQPGLGGELRDRRGELSRYDDVGCLLQALWALGPDAAGAWVEDHAGSGFVGLGQATLVRGDAVQTPMGHGVVAFRDPAAARAFATASHAEVVGYAALAADRASFAAPRGGPSARATPGQKRPFTDADVRAGKQPYLRECSACHGEKGDGAGLAASFLDPRPRDFTKRQFKLRSTESGQPPTTADVLRTIERGIPGSAMPSFAFLDAEERRQIAAYVFDRADMLDEKEPAPLEDPGPPPPSTADSIAHGQAIYEKVQCWQCHGHSGKGDGPSAAALKDDEGRPIAVRDFTGGVFRGGAERRDLYDRFVTGMDGSPMPNFKDSILGADRWALVDYVMSLRVTPAPKPLPADPILAGRAVAARYSCRGCHVLDDGRGGEVGPDLRISGQKLDPTWVRAFLHGPRAVGKIYPWRVSRMPHLALADDEIEALAKYLAAIGRRKDAPLAMPDLSSVTAATIEQGKNVFVLRCTECHTLGKVIETPLAKQQGPDLIKVAPRVDYQWAKAWISDPKKIDPKTKMTLPGITPEQIDAVRAFVWKTSLENQPPETAATTSGAR